MAKPEDIHVLASQAIAILQREIEKHGDLPLKLHGCYGAGEEIFEVIPDSGLDPDEKGKKRKHIHIWTGIMTG